MKFKVSELAIVQLGYQQREKNDSRSIGTHKLLQVKDVVTEGRFLEYFESSMGIWTGNLHMVTPKGQAWKYQIQPGDVLFVAKGNRNYGIAIDPRWVRPYPESWENVLASSHFYILRPSVQRIIPEYLAWCLNQPSTQSLLQSIATGSLMKMIPKISFENILLDVPTIEIQRKIIDLQFLSEQERYLMNSISKKRSLIIQTVCDKAAKEMNQEPVENKHERTDQPR